MTMTRRDLLLSGFGGAVVASLPAFARDTRTWTAAELVALIQREVGIPWQAETVDAIVAGAPGTHVTGIATTMVATLDVLRRAAAAKCNFVIAHEPTFYEHFDRLDWLQDDALTRGKLALVQEHRLVVFRFHDHWHLRKPDGIQVGMARALGWEAHAVAGQPGDYSFDAMPLDEFARTMATRLGAGTLRVLGDPGLPIRRVHARWGYANWDAGMLALAARDDIDVLVVGEAREWELVSYMQDLVESGAKKALVVVGHVASEQAGMRECTEWLRPLVPGVPVEFIATREPFRVVPSAG